MTAEQLINDQLVWSLLMITGVLSALVVGGLVAGGWGHPVGLYLVEG